MDIYLQRAVIRMIEEEVGIKRKDDGDLIKEATDKPLMLLLAGRPPYWRICRKRQKS